MFNRFRAWWQNLVALTTPTGWRSLGALTVAYALHMSCVTLVVYAGALIGQEFVEKGLISPSFASWPKAAVVVGKAASVAPVMWLSEKYGRKIVYAYAPFMGMVVAGCIAGALYLESFWGICVGIFALGSLTTVMHTYRFAAVDIIGVERSDIAHSLAMATALIMFGGTAAGWLGPEIALWAKDWYKPAPWMGSFAALGVLMWLAVAALQFYEDPMSRKKRRQEAHRKQVRQEAHSETKKNPKSLWTQPTFQVAASTVIVAFFINELMVTAAPLGMHHEDGHSLERTKRVIQLQQAMMYLPGLLVSTYLKRVGQTVAAGTGLAVYAIGIVIGATGTSLMHYAGSMLCLGLAWNLMYVSGTAILWASQTENGGAGMRIQRSNDQAVAIGQVIAAVSAATIWNAMGWHNMLLWCSVLIVAQVAITGRYWRRYGHLP